MDVKHCAGCEQNFYNGNNPYGVEKCWSLDSAKIIQRIRIPIDQPPPYRQKPEPLPSCYEQKRVVFIKPEALDARGYWKR